MSKSRDIADYLNDIRNAIAEVEEFTLGMDYESFAEDKKTINAVIRSLDVLGEATKHIPAPFRRKHPEIPWTKMAGMRDVLIHDYGSGFPATTGYTGIIGTIAVGGQGTVTVENLVVSNP